MVEVSLFGVFLSVSLACRRRYASPSKKMAHSSPYFNTIVHVCLQPDFAEVKAMSRSISKVTRYGYLYVFRYSSELHKIAPNFACFWPQSLASRAPNFWTCIIKRTQITIMWHSFTAIGRGRSEFSW